MYRAQDGVWGALFAGHARPDALLAGNSPSGSVFHVRLSLRCAASQSPPPPLPPQGALSRAGGRKWSLRGSLDGLDRGHGVRQRQR